MKNLLSTPRFWAILGLFTAVTATAGSLYFQYVELFAPCDLCWYQRIFLYPLVVIFTVALWKDLYKEAALFGLPLLAFGGLISIYHNILYYNANFWNPGKVAIPCEVGSVSCVERYVEFFGFITIPLLALMGTAVMIIAIIAMAKLKKN